MIRALPIDQRLAAAPEDVMAALIEVASAGHPMKIDLITPRLIFDNDYTQPEDVARFREHFPALKAFSFRIPVSQVESHLNN